MLIYSATIISFIQRIKSDLREIMSQEMDIVYNSQRFIWNNYYIPLHVVVFERPGVLGYYDPHTNELGLSKNLMFEAKTFVIKNILRHELAHMMTYLRFGLEVTGHGPEFQNICNHYGWGEEVSRASGHIPTENQKKEGDLASEKVIDKVQKLLRLAAGGDTHEAQLATVKANELMLRHNLEYLAVAQNSGEVDGDGDGSGSETEVCVERVLYFKRNNGKYNAIAKILPTFFVYPVLNYGKGGGIYLEVTGQRTNVLIADYVAKFLELELEFLWELARKKHLLLRGLAHKNSFMRGVATGYLAQAQQMKEQNFQAEQARALVVIEKNLKKQVQLVYGRLGSVRSQGSYSVYSLEIGKEVGRQLNIRPGLDQATTDTKLLN